jgi:hypothetical protein
LKHGGGTSHSAAHCPGPTAQSTGTVTHHATCGGAACMGREPANGKPPLPAGSPTGGVGVPPPLKLPALAPSWPSPTWSSAGYTRRRFLLPAAAPSSPCAAPASPRALSPRPTVPPPSPPYPTVPALAPSAFDASCILLDPAGLSPPSRSMAGPAQPAADGASASSPARRRRGAAAMLGPGRTGGLGPE